MVMIFSHAAAQRRNDLGPGTLCAVAPLREKSSFEY
jgi:hypothetical protein